MFSLEILAYLSKNTRWLNTSPERLYLILNKILTGLRSFLFWSVIVFERLLFNKRNSRGITHFISSKGWELHFTIKKISPARRGFRELAFFQHEHSSYAFLATSFLLKKIVRHWMIARVIRPVSKLFSALTKQLTYP
eukprot:c17666_g1_i1 orf=675-1085(+)